MGSGLRQNLDFGDFKRFSFLLPPKKEQEAIVTFLAAKPVPFHPGKVRYGEFGAAPGWACGTVDGDAGGFDCVRGGTDERRITCVRESSGGGICFFGSLETCVRSSSSSSSRVTMSDWTAANGEGILPSVSSPLRSVVSAGSCTPSEFEARSSISA